MQINRVRIKRERFSPRKLLIPGILMGLFWALAVAMWLLNDNIFMLVNFGYIGTSLGIGLGLWNILPKPKKPRGRRLAQFLIGGYLLILVGFLAGENIQIEGFFFSLLAGMTAAAMMHYLVAKIIGPLMIGRLWCGWACWTVMVLDLLPFKRSSGRVPGKWGWLRYTHFGLSLGVVLVMWFGFDYGKQIFWGSAAVLWWFAIGNLLYYEVGIGLAFALKDNRAFCKYVCPITVPLKLASHFAMLRIKGDANKCNECNACLKICPMDIQIVDYIKHNRERVLSTECVLCQSCISACAKDALKLSFALELGGKERLMGRAEKQALYAGKR